MGMNPLRTAVEMAFWGVARWRHGRAVHAQGVELDAELTLDADSLLGRALEVSGPSPVLVRVSRSVGLPGGWPDLLGIAVRAASGRGDEVLDVLFASVAGRGWAHPLLVPARSWWGRPWSTVLPYTGGGHLVWLGLETPPGPAGGGAGVAVVAAAVGCSPVSLAVTEMVAGAARRRVGTLRWDAVRACGAPVSFDPVLNTVAGLRPVRPLSGLREWAYTGSRRGRGATATGLAIDPRAVTPSR
jgi:hypothetical protein